MNRLDELNSLINKAEDIPESLDIGNIKRTTKRRAFRHHAVVTVRNLSVALVLMFGVVTVGVKTSPVFAEFVKELPIIRMLVYSVDDNDGLSEAIENEYGTPVNIVCKGKNFDLFVDYVMADDRTLVLFFRTNDDGGKEEFFLDIESVIAEDGTSIESSYTLPSYSSDGEYETLVYDWDKYCSKVSMDLVSYVYGSEEEYEAEQYHIELDVPEKYEVKEYEVNKEITVGNASYKIGQVRMYPLSTEIDIDYLSEDTVITKHMDFSILDESGKKVNQVMSGVTGRENPETGTWSIVIQSGYFSCGENFKLVLEYVELLDADRELVTLDLNTMEFSDSKGILPELTKAEYNDSYNAYCYKLTGEKNWKTDFLFSDFVDKKGRRRFISSGMADEGEYLLFLVPHDGTAQKKAYIKPDNQVTLVRNFPDKVIKPNLTIELEQ